MAAILTRLLPDTNGILKAQGAVRCKTVHMTTCAEVHAAGLQRGNVQGVVAELAQRSGQRGPVQRPPGGALQRQLRGGRRAPALPVAYPHLQRLHSREMGLSLARQLLGSCAL